MGDIGAQEERGKMETELDLQEIVGIAWLGKEPFFLSCFNLFLFCCVFIVFFFKILFSFLKILFF